MTLNWHSKLDGMVDELYLTPKLSIKRLPIRDSGSDDNKKIGVPWGYYDSFGGRETC